jgi:sulfur-oxidizing protein SoxY
MTKNNYTRRKALSLFSGFILALFSKASVAEYKAGQPFRDRFQTYRQTFRIEPDPEEAKRIVRNIIKGREIRNNLIYLKAPDIAENGNTVPISFSVNCSMKNNDFPKIVHILVLDNPFPEIAKFYFSPESGEAEVSIRIRMRTSSNIVAIAEMSDGTVGEAISYVDVTIGACS